MSSARGAQPASFRRTGDKSILTRAVLAATLLLCEGQLVGCARPSTEVPRAPQKKVMLERISNRDVDFHGSIWGLWPELSGKSAEIVNDKRVEYVPDLLELLEDPERYVAAHVILAHLVTHVPRPLDSRQWCGLYVELPGDGTEKYLSTPAELQTRWREVLEARRRERKDEW